ncbi:hypothetical protein D3Y79_02210 [Listeria monocytogenes]|nr:hypothetical protein [Listeria monocytogenes]EAH0491755.1 hypothetical protein [Listeria monocytogenes]EKA2549958.1 hypothetical protein [Listeria monocytogenes]EKA2553078.1 hypothetical protein [Listeria monocytogenes]EKA2556236.1 hypothetical protein [Listeria monocytogenes]
MEVTKEKVSRMEREMLDLKRRIDEIEKRNHKKDLDEKEVIHDIKRSLISLEGDLKAALKQAGAREEIALKAAERSTAGFYWAIGLVGLLVLSSIVRGFLM